jgi:hypothetical protein
MGALAPQYFDRAAGGRFSIGEKPDGNYFGICKQDCDESVRLEWFRDAETVRRSALPAELKRALG